MRNNLSNYNIIRIKMVFDFLLTIFLLIKRRDRFLIFKPLSSKRLKVVIQELGASYIKLAQVLATRADFFSGEYLAELKTLHDKVEPMREGELRLLYERSFKDDNFKSFDLNPIASASIGQVHQAYLKDGTKVAIKFRRLGIKSRIEADIKILKFFNRLFRPLFSHYTKNSVEAVINEFSIMIKEEVDFIHELKNLKKFSSTYRDNGVRFPKPFEEFCSKDVIVMSFEDGFRFDDKENLSKIGVKFEDIMGKLIYFYTKQMLINGYFHADPHPGNLLINKSGELILLDFGMLKKIPNQTRMAIIELIKSANERDFELFITACKRLGIVAHDAPQMRMQELAESMFDIFGDENLDATSMQDLAFSLLESMRDLPFKLPQEAIYMLRVSAIIEGLGTTYISNFNGIKDILPILQKHIPMALGGNEKIARLIKSEIKGIPLTARRVKKIITDLSEHALQVHMQSDSIDLMIERQKRYFKPIGRGLLLIITSFFIVALDRGYDNIAITLFLLGALGIFINL